MQRVIVLLAIWAGSASDATAPGNAGLNVRKSTAASKESKQVAAEQDHLNAKTPKEEFDDFVYKMSNGPSAAFREVADEVADDMHIHFAREKVALPLLQQTMKVTSGKRRVRFPEAQKTLFWQAEEAAQKAEAERVSTKAKGSTTKVA
eukprot:TRINITY_DN31915_c0_g1_i1.p1 TRINITY_DN31915_c0_g1~~TRINITY_DN31915_c0_g1_i1.p1  ORF type:complete len:148 (+),score=50.94 TRINITY_DN31915_c0_g1_i1:71-514(+)